MQQGLFIVNEQTEYFLISLYHWQNCHWRLRLAQVGIGARSLIEVLRNFLYKMVLSNNRATDYDFNSAVDDVRVQVIGCPIRTCKFVKES